MARSRPTHHVERLSYEDAAFVNFERPTMPMNVGSVGIYDGRVEFHHFVDHLERRIDLVPRYRQRLVQAPFNIAQAAWLDDPKFDVAHHTRSIHLDPPASDEQLTAIAGEFFATPLARDKALWEICLVEGLSGARTAHLAKVHHCMIDGVSGVSLLAALLDFDPTPRKMRKRQHRAAPPIPSLASLATDAFFDAAIDQLRLNERVVRAMLEPESVIKTAAGIVRAFGAAGKYFAVPAPAMPWNKPLAGPTRLAWQSVPLEDLRAVARKLGGKVNDAVLTIIAGAFGRYLERTGAMTADLVLRSAAPVNVRHRDEEGSLGNRVSYMLVGLPVGERDPLKRFATITAETKSLKEAHQADGVDQLLAIIGALPAPGGAFLGQTLTMPNWLSNVQVTNVQGPLAPLYLMGHRMLDHYAWVPLGWRMGVSFAVMSYDTRMYFSLSIDADAPAGIEALAAYADEEFAALRDAAGVAPSVAPKQAEDRPPEYLRRTADSRFPSTGLPSPLEGEGPGVRASAP
jgi:diacylglycerol O-acyltransferase